jgi:hypothetical protein
VVQYPVGPIITLHGQIDVRYYVDRLGNQMHLVNRKLIPKNNEAKIQFSKKTMPPFMQLELFIHGLKNMKVNFSIFPGQHKHHI